MILINYCIFINRATTMDHKKYRSSYVTLTQVGMTQSGNKVAPTKSGWK